MIRPPSFLLFLMIAILAQIDAPSASDRFLLGYEEYQPSWYSKFERELSDFASDKISSSGIAEIVESDTRGGVADLVLYYENMKTAISLFAEDNGHAASAYKAKALKHLEASVLTKLPEAQIEKAILKLDGAFYDHDYKAAIDFLISAAPHHPKARDIVFEQYLLSDYLPLERQEKVAESSYTRPLWTNEILKLYSSTNVSERMNKPQNYVLQNVERIRFDTMWVKLKNPPEFVGRKPPDNHAVSSRCVMLLIQEAESGKVDTYRKMQRCGESSWKKYKYWYDGLRKGIRAGQVHYLSDMGIALLFDDDTQNDQEGIEYLKLSISYGYFGWFRLMQYYNFVTNEIDKCQEIDALVPTKFKASKKLHIDFTSAWDPDVGVDEKFNDIEISLPRGCFEGSMRVNGKNIPITWNSREFLFGGILRVSKEIFKNKETCFEFVNARVRYHPKYNYGQSINGSKQIAFCDG